MSGNADLRWMGQAVELAQRSIGLASPNPPVGCMIVKDGQSVGQGWHEYAARDHAEVRALGEAGNRAQGAEVYVTLEPCAHFGRTPPCISALISAGVRRVAVARVDPNPGVSGSGIGALRAAGIEVETGFLHEEAGRLIEPFACKITTGTPLVVGKAGMSLDGRIAPAGGRPDSITSAEAREFSQQLRLQLDVLLVGVGTILADDPLLTYRGSLRKAPPLAVAVLDSFLRTPPAARFLAVEPGREVFIFSRADAPVERRLGLEARGAGVVPVTAGPGGLDLGQVLGELGSRNKLGVLVEGGSGVHWSFFSANLMDKFYFIVAPLILGGRDSIPVAGGAGYPSAAAAPRFRICRTIPAGPDLILETYPQYSRSILSPWIS
jgi:diaminohydroxyphosphoribosylaminopyrimidine deaminase/5-amino-6-(5-phosphoribosylamino)uracil reductase